MGKYHLPDGETLVEDLQCLVVYTPNDPVYRQALWGAISQLTKFWMWEPDGSGGEHDAADSWDLAYAATLESFGMLEQLLQAIDEVEPLLTDIKNKPACCDDALLYDEVNDPDGIVAIETDETGSDVQVGEGDPPGGIVDWPTYHDELCDRATKFAAGLINWVEALEALSTLVQIGLAAVLVGLVAGLTAVGIAAAAGALSILEVLDILDRLRTLLDVPQPWAQAKAELNDAEVREQIVCAILRSNNPAEAEQAIDDILDLVAPNAAPHIRLLPLRYIMNKVFNAETDAGGFGGSACTCPLPCIDCLPVTATCRDSVNLTFSKQQGSCTNYTIDSQTQISSDIWEIVWSVDGSHCSIVSVHCAIDNTPQAAAVELVMAERISGSEPLTFEGLDALDPANWGHSVVYSIPSTWRDCLHPLFDANHGSTPATFWDFTSARPGPAQFRAQVRVLFAAD